MLEPCPLCIFQRVVFLTLMAIFFVAAAQNPGRVGAWVYAVLLAVTAAVGAGIAGRQVWLQHLPADQVPACGPGLDYLLQKYSFTAMLEKVFRGSGECADPSWVFMGLSIAGWALIWFVLFAVLGIFLSVLIAKRAKKLPAPR
jgi:protein dithiol:quinone oxidoreductase